MKTEQQIYDIYILQSRNVRKLSKVRSNLIRDLNKNVVKNDFFEIEVKTKLLALLYSAWSEAQFVQILHTPKGLFPRIIKDIEDRRDRNGIIAGWDLMLELAFDKVGNVSESQDLSDRLVKLKSIVKENIEAQSILRNKIAHGQWVHALNRSHTGENQEYSSELRNLDYVQIDRLFKIHNHLGLIVRDLLQSPNKGFHNNYWKNLVNLESFVDRSKDWTLETRRLKLHRRVPSGRDL